MWDIDDGFEPHTPAADLHVCVQYLEVARPTKGCGHIFTLDVARPNGERVPRKGLTKAKLSR